MTSQEANDRIRAAIDTLREVRDELGAQLLAHRGSTDPERQRLLILHDRAALAVAAYQRG